MGKFRMPRTSSDDPEEEEEKEVMQEEDDDDLEDVYAPMELDADIKTVSIKLKKAGSNQPMNLEMRELSAFQRDKYLNKLKPKMERGGAIPKDFTDIQTQLLSEVLFDLDAEKYLTLAQIRDLPCTKVNMMYHRAIKVNDLDIDAEKRAKNRLSQTT